MGTDADFPILQAIEDTSCALAGDLEVDVHTVKRILSRWVLKKIPKDERHDVLQGLACRILRDRPSTPGLLYSVSRFYIADWWKARKYRQHESLDALVGDAGGESTTRLSTMADHSRPLEEFVCNVIWATEVLNQIPVEVVKVGEKRVSGFPLTATERQRLSRWRRSQGLQLGVKRN